MSLTTDFHEPIAWEKNKLAVSNTKTSLFIIGLVLIEGLALVLMNENHKSEIKALTDKFEEFQSQISNLSKVQISSESNYQQSCTCIDEINSLNASLDSLNNTLNELSQVVGLENMKIDTEIGSISSKIISFQNSIASLNKKISNLTPLLPVQNLSAFNSISFSGSGLAIGVSIENPVNGYAICTGNIYGYTQNHYTNNYANISFNQGPGSTERLFWFKQADDAMWVFINTITQSINLTTSIDSINVYLTGITNFTNGGLECSLSCIVFS